MQNRRQDKRINGVALESIMQDVLRGMQDFTSDACSGCNTSDMEIIAVEEAEIPLPGSASLLPFPARHRNAPPD